MNYPFWDIDVGYGWLMGSIAILHVFISHFAIGGGLYLVLAEMSARKLNDTFRLEFLQRLSKFFVLASVVLGALTGVGIWFIIGLLNPAATEVLIHHFVWAWATEWTFFVVEITAALVYFYGWKTMSPRNHMIVGWIYFGAAWLSLAVINGIVSFMLTPGDWLQTGNFWDGLINPTYWSALVFRTGVCVMLAGIYALAVAAFLKPDKAKASLIRYNAVWAVVGLVIMAPTYRWYFNSIPETIRTAAIEKMPTVISRISEGWWLGMALTAVVILFGLIIPRWYYWLVGVVVMALGLVVFGEYEWMREAIRKPYVIHGYMYGNAVEVSDVTHIQTDGMLPHIAYRTGDDGADLFRHACRSCHTMDGYKALKPRFDGTDEAFIAAMVRGVGVMRGNMPPFVGTSYESELIAAHVYSKTDHRSLSEIYGLSGVELGRKVYEIRCGSCHQFGGYSDKAASLTGLSDDDYNNLLDLAGELADEMPDFTASDKERAALIEYLKTLPEGGAR
jgi:mono/diheme cytochrome c family protein/cytochrome bd-type quinol oxidase subunit 1